MTTGFRTLPRVAAILALCVCNAGKADVVRLGELDLSKMSSGWGTPVADNSVTGKAISIAGRTFGTGVGTHATSELHAELDGKVERFKAFVGVDDAAGQRGTARFMVYADGKRLFDSGIMKGGQAAQEVDVPLVGARPDAHGDFGRRWGELRPRGLGPGRVPGRGRQTGSRRCTESTARGKGDFDAQAGAAPKINGPKVQGCRPGRPFLYRIPCTGNRPITFGEACRRA